MALVSLLVEIGAYLELKLAVILASDPTDFSLEEKRKKKSRCCDEDLQRVAEVVAFHTIRAPPEYLQRGKSGD